MTRMSMIAFAGALAIAAAACGDGGPLSKGGSPSVRITSPADGAEVSSPVTVTMEATGFTIKPAGEVSEGTGHFHVIVDVGCVEEGKTIPNGENYIHLGKAQKQVELNLTPGPHELCLQAGDGVHTALNLTDIITITVTE